MEIDLLYKKDNMLGEGTKILPIKQFSFFLLSPPFLTAYRIRSLNQFPGLFEGKPEYNPPPFTPPLNCRVSFPLYPSHITRPNPTNHTKLSILPLQSSSSFLIVINTYNRSSNMYEDCAVKVKIGK